MAVKPLSDVRAPHLRLMLPPHADIIASWVRTGKEALMLAPRTVPPITTQTISSWTGPGCCQFVLMPETTDDQIADISNESSGHPHAILGYGELNELDPARRSYWLGHLIIDPAQRGLGYGLLLTQLLMTRAFERCGAKRVTLVVFPENLAAVACYKRAGFEPDGFENHRTADGTRIRLLRMAVQR